MAAAVTRPAPCCAAGSPRSRRSGFAARCASNRWSISSATRMGVAGSTFSKRLWMGWEDRSRAPPGPVGDVEFMGDFRPSAPRGPWHRPCYRSRVEGRHGGDAGVRQRSGVDAAPGRSSPGCACAGAGAGRTSRRREIRKCGCRPCSRARLARLVGAARARVVPLRPASPASAPKGIPKRVGVGGDSGPGSQPAAGARTRRQRAQSRRVGPSGDRDGGAARRAGAGRRPRPHAGGPPGPPPAPPRSSARAR